jgi:hypothetical protein
MGLPVDGGCEESCFSAASSVHRRSWRPGGRSISARIEPARAKGTKSPACDFLKYPGLIQCLSLCLRVRQRSDCSSWPDRRSTPMSSIVVLSRRSWTESGRFPS